jgi:hypothetical protein
MRSVSLAGRLALAAALGAVVVVTHAACCSVPSYTPSFWNDAGTVQSNNNCYNYSNNKRTDTFAQPGRAAGAMYGSLTCPAVHTAATADGLTPVASGADCPNTQCRLALVVAPGWDYHWYRLDANGMWTHKPGQTRATNLDNSSNPIPNPETANRGAYTDFCGYFCACSSSTEGNGHENIN